LNVATTGPSRRDRWSAHRLDGNARH
jgi:hypothetical protein